MLTVYSLFPRLFIPHSRLPHPTQPTCLIAWVLIKYGMIIEGILISPNGFLHLFSTYFLTQHYDFRPKHVALHLSIAFPLTVAPCHTLGIMCLFDLFTPRWMLRLPEISCTALHPVLDIPTRLPSRAACDWLWVQTPRQEC